MRLAIWFFMAAMAAAAQEGSFTWLAPYNPWSATPANASNMILNAPGERLAWRFSASTTSPITHADVYLTASATPPETLWKMRIYAQSGSGNTGLPDEATPLSGESEEFSVSATGATGPQQFATPTAALTLNAEYWLVMYKSSGPDPDAIHYVQARHTAQRINRGMMRLYNGTDWTTVAAVLSDPFVLFTHADNRHRGYPATQSWTAPATIGIPAGSVGGANRHGIVFRAGSGVVIRGVMVYLFELGTPPGDLEVLVYDGAVQKAIQTIPAVDVSFSGRYTFWFSSPPTISAATDCYIVLRQSGNLGDNGNGWAVTGHGLASGYIDSMLPSSLRFVYGTGDDPAALAVQEDGYAPFVIPIISDPATDLVAGPGGGTSGGKWISVK